MFICVIVFVNDLVVKNLNLFSVCFVNIIEFNIANIHIFKFFFQYNKDVYSVLLTLLHLKGSSFTCIGKLAKMYNNVK